MAGGAGMTSVRWRPACAGASQESGGIRRITAPAGAHRSQSGREEMKLRLAVALVLLFVGAAGCAKRTPPATATPTPTPTAGGGITNDAAARARADSIAAAELARRQAEERGQREQVARAREVLTTVVYFEYDSDQLSSEAQDRLRTKASILRANPALELRVEGHADERGSTEYNLALGQRRAEAVRTFLTGYGIPSTRLSTISYGKERPAAQGSNEAAYARNRRAEFAVTAGEISAIPPEVR
jgi:peptidoglycan-associated lipoprotein